MNKHPYGRLASVRHGVVQIATGLVVVFSLGEIQPHWVLNNAFTTAQRAHRKARGHR